MRYGFWGRALVVGVFSVMAQCVDGQVKELYDSTANYRKTGYVSHLSAARKLADSVVASHASGGEREPSDDAIAAAALVELSQYVGAVDRDRYRGWAEKRLLALSSSAKSGAVAKDKHFLEASRMLRELKAKEESRSEIRAKLPERRGLPGADRAGWAALATHPAAAKIIAKAEADLRQPIPDTPDDLYLEFWSTGNRSHYQKPYFDRVRQFVTLTVAEALERKGRFIPKIVELVDALCAMKSWVLPAHDHVDGKQGNFRGTALNVDLFASQLASHLAYAVNFIGDSLPSATLAKIRMETERRIFGPLRLSYSLADDAGRIEGKKDPLRHWWTYCGSNWNAVCHDNVATAALGLLDDAEDRAFFVANALRGLGYYARGGFASDGYCSEGMGYWNYGFGHLLMLGLVLRDLTAGGIDIFAEPIYRKAAEYAYKYQLERGVSPAFADGNGAPSAANLALVRRAWPDLTCRSAEMVSPFGTVADGVAGIYDDHYTALLGFGKMAPPSGMADAPLPLRSEFPVGQVWLMRCGEELSVAVKGGHNGELHNHNDVGSYYLVSHGRLLSGDPGGEEYTARTFSARRYESKVLSSYGHPVPVVGGCLQSTGAKFAAKVLATEFSDLRDTVVLDISGAYDVKSLKTLVRTFSFDRVAKTFTVSDRVEFSEPADFEEAYNTFKGGKFGEALVDVAVAAGGETVRAVEHIDNPGRTSPDRHSVRFASPVTKAEISFTFKVNPRKDKKK